MQDFLSRFPNWERCGNPPKLCRSFAFKNFLLALDFVNQVGDIAEEMQHHPDVFLTWGRVEFHLSTHDTSMITEKDFALAEKIEALYRPQA